MTSHPLSHIRGLLIAERAFDWPAFLSPFTQRGICIDAFDSATAALAALSEAAAQANPYRVVLLGHRVQGMDATVLAAAIKGDPACQSAILAYLSERADEDAAALQDAGFSALIHQSTPADAALAILDQVWHAAANAGTPDFLAHAPAAKWRMLVVDDNPINREVAVRLLEKAGHECAVAGNGRDAVDMHTAAAYSLILMDCEMPVMDGFEATRLIRSTESPSRRTPIVALTASNEDHEREKCLASGMDDFLSKPIRPQMLGDLLSRWLPRTSAPLPLAEPPACEDELEAIRDMFGADFAELAALYRRDSPPRIASLHEAYADGDIVRVAKFAHALGGSSASIGATGMAALCKTLEKQAKAGVLNEFKTRMAAIEAEYQRVSSKLQSLLE